MDNEERRKEIREALDKAKILPDKNSDQWSVISKTKNGEREDVISLKNVKWLREETCHHNNIFIDEQKAEVECADCGLLLNPIGILTRMASNEAGMETRYRVLHEEYEKIKRKIEEKTRCRCDHCNKITDIHIK